MNENKTNINCEKPIYINIDSNHWKYWIFDDEIFTFLIKKYYNMYGIVKISWMRQ